VTSDAEQSDGLPAELQAWVVESTGGRITDDERVMGGASREAWLVNVQRDGESVIELFLRRDNGTGPMQGTPYTVGREATVYRALTSTPVPVPAVIAIHPDGNTVLLERIEGEAYFPAAGDAREQLAEQFVEILAALHTTDVDTLDVPMLVCPRTPEEHATLELDIWEALQRERGRPDPLVSFTLRWLRARVPLSVDRTVLVQGDTGPGNFMFRDGRIVAVVDWELAHLGDPMEDLAWVVTRSLLQPFVPLAAWFRRYEELSGIAIDDERLDWWVVCNVLRCVIGEGVVTESGEANPERGMIYGLLQMHRRVVVDALARASGRDLLAPAALPAPGAHDATKRTERTRLFELVADTIDGALLPEIDDPMTTHQGRAMVRLVRHLALVDRLGPAVDAHERDEIGALLGRAATDSTGTSADDAREKLLTAIEAGELDDDALMQYFRNETSRQAPLVQPMLGRLATVELPDWRE
jgi:aminoglycoside phosphotransferase (APT) family kinase protein